MSIGDHALDRDDDEPMMAVDVDHVRSTNTRQAVV